MKVLLAVDGSENALRATRKLIESVSSYKEPIEVELVTVHQPTPYLGAPFSGAVLTREMIDSYYREEGTKSLAPSKQLLDEAGVGYHPHILVGQVAETLVEHAEKSGCDMIYMGTRGHTAISSLVLGSIATKVLHLARVPVTLVR